MNLNPNHHEEHGKTLSKLEHFFSQKLSKEDATYALKLIVGLENIHESDGKSALCLIRLISEQRDRARKKAEGLFGILCEVFRTAGNADIAILKPHFKTLRRFIEEQQAPESTDEEIEQA